MKKFLMFSLVCVIALMLVACSTLPTTEKHETGFDMDKLFINVNGNTYAYERYAPGVGSLTKNRIIDEFSTATEIEGIAWVVYSVMEYPDLSYVLVISGTNSSWTYRISDDTE